MRKTPQPRCAEPQGAVDGWGVSLGKPADGYTKRRLLTRGVGAILSGILGRFLAPCLATTSTIPSRAKSVILIFNGGAPSHIDLWDPKPNAPSETRGPFSTIRTSVPGIHVSELLPSMAKRMHRLALIRSVHHQHSSHNAGMHWANVGRPYRVDSTLIHPSRTDLPGVGSLVGWLAQRDGFSAGVPPYVITPFPTCDSKLYITPGQDGACLGPRFDPFVLDDDPNAPEFKVRDMSLLSDVSKARFQDRVALLKNIESFSAPLPSDSMREHEIFRNRAATLLASGNSADAFDLSNEPEKVRERYGRHAWGQSHLLARRLVEAGTRFVTTVNGPSIIWDTHKDNFNSLRNRLVPPMEQAYAALLDDLEERGLLDSTLVVWMGEFGRTPKINADAGRDHWPGCYSVLLAGGGVRGGQVIGASDAIGALPTERAVSPADIHASMFAALGYDPASLSFTSSDGRPIPLTEGKVISELF